MTVLLALSLTALITAPGLSGQDEPRLPFVIAHRGASADAPENTLAAFREAMTQGADAIELDIRRSRDGRLIILHDATVDRTTTGSGKAAAMTMDDLSRTDAGIKFAPAFTGEKIPTLEEALSVLDATTLVIAELKDDPLENPGIEQQVIETVRSSGHTSQVILKSFEPDVIRTFARLAPEIPRVFVYAFRLPWVGLIVGQGLETGSVFDVPADYLQPHWFLTSGSFVREAHERGFKVITWGTDDRREMLEAAGYGVDGIETNSPGLLRELLTHDFRQSRRSGRTQEH